MNRKWYWEPGSINELRSEGPPHSLICYTEHPDYPPSEEISADESLISAAPELLEALKAAEWGGPAAGLIKTCPVCKKTNTFSHAPDCILSAAIKKAEDTQ